MQKIDTTSPPGLDPAKTGWDFAEVWIGPIPHATEQLVRMLELKLVAKAAGFSRIKPEGKQHVVMETPMEEPAWKKISEKLSSHLKSRFVYSGGKVVVRGLGGAEAREAVGESDGVAGVFAGGDRRAAG